MSTRPRRLAWRLTPLERRPAVLVMQGPALVDGRLAKLFGAGLRLRASILTNKRVGKMPAELYAGAGRAPPKAAGKNLTESGTAVAGLRVAYHSYGVELHPRLPPLPTEIFHKLQARAVDAVRVAALGRGRSFGDD